jgi:hypothetical protein
MPVRILRLGTARAKDEGLRIGTVRRPPRGVPKTKFASQNWYDIWFPHLAPGRYHHENDLVRRNSGSVEPIRQKVSGRNVRAREHARCRVPRRALTGKQLEPSGARLQLPSYSCDFKVID